MDTGLQKYKKKNDLFFTTEAEHNIELNTEVPQDQINEQIKLYQDEEVHNLELEAKDQFEKIWEASESEVGYAKILSTAKRYDLDRAYEGGEAEQLEKEKIKAELEKMEKFSTTRTGKSRKKHVGKAHKSYKKAAKSIQKLTQKRGSGHLMDAIEPAESLIIQMTEGERELVKAEGLKNKTEEYNLARLSLKRNMMLRDLYNFNLAKEGISQKDKDKLTTKLDIINQEIEKNKEVYLPVVVENAITWKDADVFNGALIMNKKQFDNFASKVIGRVPQDIKELGKDLQALAKNKKLVSDKNVDNDAFSSNILNILTSKCSSLKIKYKKNLNVIKVLDVLYTQINRQVDITKYKEVEDAVVEKNVVDEVDQEIDEDAFSDYKVMEPAEYVDQMSKNKYNSNFFDEDLNGIYGTFWQQTDDYGLEKAPFPKFLKTGYILTPNGSLSLCIRSNSSVVTEDNSCSRFNILVTTDPLYASKPSF
ncbi:MAG: hypothetical protein K6F00_06295 [Lachnospiraceae bacterium]|nr:hypothetical protein [Lachnospiraceae bacterium]